MLYKLSTFLLLLTLLSFALVAHLAYFKDYKPFEVFDVRVETPDIKAGGVLKYTVDYCKYLDIPGTVSKVLVDGIFIPFAPYVTQSLHGCGTNTVSQELPNFIDSGTYYLDITVEYQVNPIRKIYYHYQTPSFKVTNE